MVLEYAQGDRLSVPTDSGRDGRAVRRRETCRGCRGSARATGRARRTRVKRAVKDMAGELVRLYSVRMSVEGHAFGPDTPWQARARGRLPARRDRRSAHGDRRGEGRHGAAQADGPADLRRRRVRQDRDRGSRGVQGRDGRQAGGGARADDAARRAALHHVLRTLRALPREGRDALAIRLQGRAGPRRRGPEEGCGRRGDRDAPAPQPGHRVQGRGSARRRRGAALRRRAQGAAEEAPRAGGRADDDRHADPAHAGDGAHRDPRHVDDRHAAGRPAARPHVRRPVRRGPRARCGPARAAARGPGLLGPQPGGDDRPSGRRGCRSRSRRRGSSSRTARWTSRCSSSR